jgi:dipeptidase
MCDSVVAVGSETASGVTLFGKNSDRKGGECQPLVQLSEAHHPPRAVVQCTHVEIPQVAETYRVLGHSPWWVWGFEHGVNEHGVAIGNHTVFSNEPLEEEHGLIGMDLVRLGLERGRDAREALEVIATLLETHGQGGPARAPGGAGYHNSFLLADPESAWLLETSNRRWVARRVSLEGVSNHIVLRDDWEISSRDLESFARAQGWWRSSGRVDVAAAYRNPHVPARISEGRQGRARELLRSASGEHDLDTFRSLLRDHFAGGLAWHPGATPEDDHFFTLCAHSEPIHATTASLIAPLPLDRSGPWPVWVCFGTPCSGVFLPVYLDGVIPASLARGGAEPELDSAWWTFKRLQDEVDADPLRYTPELRAGWRDFEEQVECDRVEVERSARRAARSGDRDQAARVVSDFMARTVEDALKLADSLRTHIA